MSDDLLGCTSGFSASDSINTFDFPIESSELSYKQSKQSILTKNLFLIRQSRSLQKSGCPCDSQQLLKKGFGKNPPFGDYGDFSVATLAVSQNFAIIQFCSFELLHII